mmetsp:Transcript_20067/g.19043  ORF Transcript_20067/g.19043 Transcript_20067/m.19043 type:complete len:158 (-) Transcript_20067:936-1409(-)|eukprot:CAMPEP_0170548700 /NCGR_PEP_ID=MMETSP0211-20121228/6930_1 /TAXON_ID=311385 /ORGANISM="Pseudokeronopsis sp., Strain OXSARD2" /LENGTH=157 /DNA_ID=CAMNT_0010854323 /DNA_START=320 /DNA_END=793 /DNA_ORIENTATION=+
MAQVQKSVVSKPQYLGRGGAPRKQFGDRKMEQLEEEEDDEDPEWIDFDPKKEAVKHFFGREIPNELELRKQVKASRELEEEKQKMYGKGKVDDDDEFEKMIEAEQSKKKEASDEFEKEAEHLANEIMKSHHSYSDIDLIVEKKVKSSKPKEEALDDQ